MKHALIAILFLTGCAPSVVYRDVKVPVPQPCEVTDPVVYELPVVDVNELTVRDAISRKEYGEIVYSIGSSLILLNGDVKAYREVLEACK